MLLAIFAQGLVVAAAPADEKDYPFGKGPVKWVSTEWLQNHMKDPGLIVIDVQPDVHDYVIEHIPGAVHLSDQTLRASERGMPARYLRPQGMESLFCEVTPDKTVLVYCGTGREATNEFLLFKWYLGYPNVKIYEGSFTEWCAYPENPTVTGPNPR